MMQQLDNERICGEKYERFRPSYPEDVKKTILAFLEDKRGGSKGKRHDLLVDVGCGSGETTRLFAPYFGKVVGIDMKQEQVDAARERNKLSHVSFEVGRAERLVGVADSSVDLVLGAESAHWFDLEAFLMEAMRVLRPGGCLALIGYWLPRVVPVNYSGNAADLLKSNFNLIQEAFAAEIQEEWDCYKSVAAGYKDIFDAIPVPDKMRRDEFRSTHLWNMEELGGFLRSRDVAVNSARRRLRQARAENGRLTEEHYRDADVVAPFVERLAKSWGFQGAKDPCISLNVEFKFFAVLARKPGA